MAVSRLARIQRNVSSAEAIRVSETEGPDGTDRTDAPNGPDLTDRILCWYWRNRSSIRVGEGERRGGLGCRTVREWYDRRGIMSKDRVVVMLYLVPLDQMKKYDRYPQPLI